MAVQRTSDQTEQRFFAPEVIQTSATDCGPAALKCLLEGFGIPISYGRLREACQTDVDGTSIDTIEDVARQVGLAVEQLIAPPDHLLLTEAHLLPALVVTVLPNGLSHFVVVWRVVGPLIQIMDPATGRRWLTRQQFQNQLYRHALPFTASTWRKWAGSAGFVDPLRRRLEDVHIRSTTIADLFAIAHADEEWQTFAALDATVRFVDALVRNGGVQRGAEAETLVNKLFEQSRGARVDALAEIIPSHFWLVTPLLPSREQPTAVAHLQLRGVVLLHVQGRYPHPQTAPDSPAQVTIENATSSATALSPELAAALAEAPSRPEWEVLKLWRSDGLLQPSLLLSATALAASAVILEAVLLRGVMVVAALLPTAGAYGILLGLCAFMLSLLLLEIPLTQIHQRVGRRLEARLRIRLLEKIARLGDHYFRSRLISDMADRAHSLHQLHSLPDLALRTVSLAVQLLLTAAGVIWLDPGSLLPVTASVMVAMGAALLTQPILNERDLRVRTHVGALSRFYLDALLGLIPIRTHSAERTVRREHEMLLVEWVRASFAFQHIQRIIQAIVSLAGLSLTIWIVFQYLSQRGEASGVLLLLYWTLNLPALGQALVSTVQQYPIQRNRLLRLLEPLGAPEEDNKETAPTPELADDYVALSSASPSDATLSTRGVAITLENVSVRAGGQLILHEINLTLQPGEHVAIVGASGAGKSSLAGLLLGWHRPASGLLLIDGEVLTSTRLQTLRSTLAWVDPSVQLWNRTLRENLYYGAKHTPTVPISVALEAADLYAILEKLPNDVETRLGESGGLVSGGEGQRVRLGRALVRPNVRLAVLDEPFRGLDRGKRRQLLANARRQWRDATLLCITHDIGETQNFKRVIVLEEGQIVEDAPPQVLAERRESRYRALLAAETVVRRTLWESTDWRHLWLDNGRLEEKRAE